MKAEVKQLWLDALRSGKYEQATGVLTRRDCDGTKSHCCLGVLCEIAIKNGLELNVGESYDSNITYDGSESLLPSRVVEWAMLENDVTGEYDVDVAMPLRVNTLADFNDGGFTFGMIADIIERFL